jgi:hypothetical protein
MTTPTHDQAFDALCDPGVPVVEALTIFKRAHRRSNGATKGFVLHFAGNIRSERKRKAAKESA